MNAGEAELLRGTQGSEKRVQTALSKEMEWLRWVDFGLVTELSVPAFRTGVRENYMALGETACPTQGRPDGR